MAKASADQPQTPIDYATRINRTLEALGDRAALIRATPMAVRNSDVHHPWRQESLFHFLTGFTEPGSALFLNGAGADGERVLLFVRPKNELRELWDGFRLGVDAASTLPGIDQAHDIGSMWTELPNAIKSADAIYAKLGIDRGSDAKLIQLLMNNRHRKLFGTHHIPLLDIDELAGRLRMKKEPSELERMRKAAAATAHGFNAVLQQLKPGMNERQVHGLLIQGFLEAGAEMEAYPSIVAGGANACILHYVENNATLADGDLLLIDAGAQFDYYAADVTRTIPVGKSISTEQKNLYEICLKAQIEGLALCKPGATLANVHDKCIAVITEGLRDLGILEGSQDECIEKKSFFKYFPHGTSHWIGMDVHDVGAYGYKGEDVTLEAGNCFTVEPGIYIPPKDEEVPEPYRGIGIRIEDDVCITDGGCEILTAEIPKELDRLIR